MHIEVLDNLISLGTIEDQNSKPDDSALVCWRDSMRRLEKWWGYAIYETCRVYDLISDRQICHDILITTDGYNDHTSYVDIPSSYTYKKRDSSKSRKLSCLEKQKVMKKQLLELFPLSLLF